MNLRKRLQEWREPHSLGNIATGWTLEVEKQLGRSYHQGRVRPEEYCAICLACDACIACSILGYTDAVLFAARAHANDIALTELRKLGVRLLDEMNE